MLSRLFKIISKKKPKEYTTKVITIKNPSRPWREVKVIRTRFSETEYDTIDTILTYGGERDIIQIKEVVIPHIESVIKRVRDEIRKEMKEEILQMFNKD